LITITGIQLVPEDESGQLSFLEGVGTEREDTEERLERTMDKIRERYGSCSITYGRILGNDIGIELDEQRDDGEEGF
jgi:hypothetical protein